MSEPTPRPLFVVTDAGLLEQLLALASSVGVEPELAPDAFGAKLSWLDASLVVLDAAAAADCARSQLPRRAGVVLLSGQSSPDEAPHAIERMWQLAAQLDADNVVQLPVAATWLTDRLRSAVHGPGGKVIGVVGGRGGAGASVLSVALAVTAATGGLRTLLMDADPLGGGLDVLLGREQFSDVRWPEVARQVSTNSADIREILPRLGELSLLSWDRGDQQEVTPELLWRIVTTAKRGSDAVIIDLPRAPDPAARVALGSADLIIVVVPAEVRSVASAARVVASIRSYCARIMVVVRTPGQVGLKPTEIATALHLPLLGSIKHDPGLSLAIERGTAFSGRSWVTLREACQDLLRQLIGRASSAAA